MNKLLRLSSGHLINIALIASIYPHSVNDEVFEYVVDIAGGNCLVVSVEDAERIFSYFDIIK